MHILHLRIARAREAVARRVLVDRPTRNVETETTHAATNQDDRHVDNGQANLSWRRKPPAPVNVQPVHATETVTEPTGEERADQTQKIIEHWNGVGDDPGDNPAGQTDRYP